MDNSDPASVVTDCRVLCVDGKGDIVSEKKENVVLCGSNSYNKKYYFNKRFSNLPKSVQDELQIMCVWFTEECGGVLMLEFNGKGKLQLTLATSEYDGYYDEIGADLKIHQMQKEKKDFFHALELYYQISVLGIDLETLERLDEKGTDE